jgi:hypothetical protein
MIVAGTTSTLNLARAWLPTRTFSFSLGSNMLSTFLNSDRWITGRPAHHSVSRVELTITGEQHSQRRTLHVEELVEFEILSLLKPSAEVLLFFDLTEVSYSGSFLFSDFERTLSTLWPYIELLGPSRLLICVRYGRNGGLEVCKDLKGEQGRAIVEWTEALRKVSR